MPAEPLVVTFADSHYQPLLAIWLDRLAMLNVARVRVYALDAAVLAWCRARGVDCEPVEWQGSLRDLWTQRIRVFSALLAQDQGFIHSDTDAIWVRDPLKHGAAYEPEADLMFSQGTVWPPEVHARWGFVLCCGWFRARPTSGVRDFFRALERDVLLSGDDQVSVNRLLAAGKVHWDRGSGPDYQIEFDGRSLHCWNRVLRGVPANQALSVALLPHREFQRLPEASEKAVVKHFLTPKRCEEKLIALRHLGLIP